MLSLFESLAVARAVSRRALDVIIIWFVLLVAFALAPPVFGQWFVELLMLLPLVAAALLARAFPLSVFGSGIAAASDAKVTIRGRKFGAPQVRAAATALAMLLATQLGMGVYTYLVPVHQARGLVPPLIALVAMFALLGPIAGIDLRAGARRWLVVIAVLLVGITILFFAGGTDGVKERVSGIDLPNGSAQSAGVSQATERTVVAPTQGWSGWVSLPLHSQFRIDPQDVIDVQFQGTGRQRRVYAVHYNKPVDLGHSLQEGAIRVRSASGVPDQVTVTFAPR